MNRISKWSIILKLFNISMLKERHRRNAYQIWNARGLISHFFLRFIYHFMTDCHAKSQALSSSVINCSFDVCPTTCGHYNETVWDTINLYATDFIDVELTIQSMECTLMQECYWTCTNSNHFAYGKVYLKRKTK